MQNKILGALAACFLLVQIGDALDCYNCAPPNQCENVDSLTPFGCGNAAVPPQKPACQKITMKRKDSTDVTYLRRCVTATGEDDKSQCQAPLGYEQIECNVCFEDKCNSAGTAQMGLVTGVSILFALFLGRAVLA